MGYYTWSVTTFTSIYIRFLLSSRKIKLTYFTICKFGIIFVYTKKNEVWLLLLRSDATLDFRFFLFDCVERVDGVVLESSSVSEGREKEDIFLYFIKQRLMKTKWRTCINYQLTRCRRKCVTLRPNKVIKFPKRLILNPESNITHLWPWFCNLIINIMFFPLAL